MNKVNLLKVLDMSEEDKWECKRCGRCCMHMHSDDTGMPCESLLVKNGIATCLMHDDKPEVCKNYPSHPDFGGEPCFFERDVVTYYQEKDWPKPKKESPNDTRKTNQRIAGKGKKKN